MPLPAGGGVWVPAVVAAEALAGFAGAAALAVGVAAGAAAAGAAAGAGLEAGAALAAGAAAGAAVASALALVFLLLLLAAGVAAELVVAGAVDEPDAGAAVESAAAFFDRVFLAAVAESLDASGVAFASAVFEPVFLAVVEEPAEAADVAEESAAAVFDDFVFFVLLVASLAELSVLVALESAAAVFFLDLVFDVPAAVDESPAAVESEAAVAFFVFFFVVLVLLSALESLCVSCARTCVVNRNRPMSAVTARTKNRVRRILLMTILRMVPVWSHGIVETRSPIELVRGRVLPMPRLG